MATLRLFRLLVASACVLRAALGGSLLDWLVAGNRSILCFGDSLTAGHYPVARKVEYRPYSIALKSMLDAETRSKGKGEIAVITAGLDGERTGAMALRMPLELSRQPSVGLAIILGGTNDMANPRIGVEQVVSNLQLVHSVAWSRGAYTLPVTLPTLSWIRHLPASISKFHAVNAHLRSMPRAGNASHVVSPCLDMAQQFIPQDNATQREYWSHDRAHLSDKGYAAMGEMLFKIVANADRPGALPQAAGL